GLPVVGLMMVLACDSTQVNTAETEVLPDEADASSSDAASSNSPTDDIAEMQEGSCVTGPCAPTLNVMTWVEPCTSDADCTEGLVCLPCQASSTCTTKDCLPACGVPYEAHAFVPEPLRLSGEWTLEANSPGQVYVEGTSFFAGALGHRFRLGDEEVPAQYGAICTAALDLPARPTGLYPIWTSQYSGDAPWALSGFVRYGDGVACVQPGLACNDDCCATEEVPMECRQGRCRRL
ncbi:MAG: hypothetical protein AAFS10_19270, partial [Myxococcota bacterium]